LGNNFIDYNLFDYCVIRKLNTSELRFRDICVSRGFSVTKSDRSSDMYEHWDFKVNDSLVDVKGLKRISRSNSEFSTDYTWVEFKNVRGQKGWLQGIANYIAFEQLDHFLIVGRLDLLHYCQSSISKELVQSSKDSYYKLYSRAGRKDIISLISLSLLKKHVKTWLLKFS
jgi:hypothetical protein